MFESLPITANLGIFAAAAAAVWFAGTRLAHAAETIADRTGLSRAFVGLLLLAAATSLPEIATTATAAWIGNARLAINNLTGGIAMQTAILAVVDIVALRAALTFFTPRPVLLLQGTLLTILLAIAIAATTVGEPFGAAMIGVWPPLIAATFVFGLYASRRYEQHPGWQPTSTPDRSERRGAEGETRASEKRLTAAVLTFLGASAVVLVAGWTVSSIGDVLARETGLGGSFVGATLVAISTSLPELSTTLAAARRGAYGMAISNIFGSNAFDISLLLVADICYREGPILEQFDRSATFSTALGLVMTAVYLWGMLERRDRTFLRMGLDSLVVLVLYIIGIGVLYTLR